MKFPIILLSVSASLYLYFEELWRVILEHYCLTEGGLDRERLLCNPELFWTTVDFIETLSVIVIIISIFLLIYRFKKINHRAL